MAWPRRRCLAPLAVAILAVAAVPVLAGPAAPATAGDPSPGAAPGVVYTARDGDAEVRLVGLGEDPAGTPLILLDVRVECEGFHPQGRMVATVEENGRFEVEGTAIDPGTTDVVVGEFDDIDGRVREDGAVLEIDVEVRGADNAGPTGRCEETQEWRLQPRRSAGAALLDGAVATDADVLTATTDALYALERRRELARLDPATLEEVWSVETSPDAAAVAAAGDAVWVVDAETLEVARHDAAGGDEVATVALVPPEVADSLLGAAPAVVATPTALWVAVDEVGTISRVDAATNAVTTGTLAGRVTGLAPAPDGVFAAIGGEAGAGARIVRISESGAEVQSVPVAGSPEAIAADASRVWTRDSGSIAAYDAATLTPVGTASVAAPAATFSEVVAGAAPGVWTGVARGLAAFDPAVTRTNLVPVVTTGGGGLVATADALFALDAGHLVRIALAER